MNNPIAVIISDLHFNLNNLQVATLALQSAINKAKQLQVPLIIAGDLHDTKAIIRAEVANRLIDIISSSDIKIIIIEGNHDKINEKGIGHGLNYLKPYAQIIDHPFYFYKNVKLIPYLNEIPKQFEFPVKSILIMHQGFKGAWMGDYIQDKTSVDPELVKDYIVFSGHYHKHQTIGTVTYIGSPYTITFGEANDGEKGFLIINEDGSYTREILHLRKHIIVEFDVDKLKYVDLLDQVRPEDILWIKIKGPESELKKLNKKALEEQLGYNFRLDLISNSTGPVELVIPLNNLTDRQILDNIIDNLGETDKQKKYLKDLYREVIES